uniref:Transmembrane protein n=1 Tax=Trypanosoma congolense (strain IL3000) TaxID=1068625 RepID=G0UVE5_TRYCI|nr:conserved hypothetical protein [Trypanosoma congolense IL3000]
MFCPGRAPLLASTASLGFSSASFTGDDGGEYQRQESTRTLHHAEAERGNMHESQTSGSSARPTVETYRRMATTQLEALLRRRDDQVRQLRVVYENFHYEADKCFRTMVFDYHEKALQLSQVHGKMQLGSLQISREALVKMREQQEMYSRDHRIVVTICTIFSFLFWIWIRRHYVRREELFGTTLDGGKAVDRRSETRSVCGAGSFNENPFSSVRRNARNVETSWEREVREKQGQQQSQNHEE